MSSWIAVGALTEIAPRGARVVRVLEVDIAVFRTTDDRVFALRDRCPHRGGPLSEGIIHGARVTCPLHTWVIDLSSAQAVAPDKGCVTAFPVRIIDGIVQIDVTAAERSPETTLEGAA